MKPQRFWRLHLWQTRNVFWRSLTLGGFHVTLMCTICQKVVTIGVYGYLASFIFPFLHFYMFCTTFARKCMCPRAHCAFHLSSLQAEHLYTLFFHFHPPSNSPSLFGLFWVHPLLSCLFPFLLRILYFKPPLLGHLLPARSFPSSMSIFLIEDAPHQRT